MQRIEAEHVADLTTMIFAAGLNPARWTNVLEELHKFTDGVRINMFGRDMETGRLFGFMSAGYDDSHMDGYDEHFRHLNVWVDKFSSSQNSSYMSTAEMYPLNDLFRTEFYHDWVKPQEDMYGGGAVMLFNERDRFLAFGGHIRAKDRDRLESGFERLARLLTPHVRQAFEVNRALEGKAISDFLSGVPGRPSTGVMLLRSDERILFANQAAQDWIAAGSPINVDVLGRIGSGDIEIATFLKKSVQSLLDLKDAASSEIRTRQSNGSAELTLRAARFVPDRLQESPFGLLHSGDTRALLLTIEMKPVDDLSITALLQRHRLTPSEIDVALQLADGIPVSTIAERRRVSVYTIRNQRHAILSKLELKSQSQLARMLLGADRK